MIKASGPHNTEGSVTIKASGPHNTEGSVTIKASGPYNTEGPVTVIQSLEHTKTPATAGPVFINGSNLTIWFPQKGNNEFIFTGKSPAGTSRCNHQIRVSVPSVSSISGWGWPPHSTHTTSSAFRTYLRHSDRHHNTLGHKYPNILSGGTLDTPQVYSYPNYYYSPIK